MDSLIIDKIAVNVNNKQILRDFSINIKSGEIHAIMGPNGTGKSTLSRVIMGDQNYQITSGKILFNNEDITNLPTNERAQLGIFLGMQNPNAIEGITNAELLRTAVSLKEKENFQLFPFIKKMETVTKQLNMNNDMIHRDINIGFSGGEKKKNEILQMYMLEPKIIILDEIDSGLDVDALKIVSENIMEYYKKNKPAILLITHYQRLLDYIKPTHVHIMLDGQIIKSGDRELSLEIEKYGYNKFLKDSTTKQEKND